MRKCIEIPILNVEEITQKTIQYASKYSHACVLNSNGFDSKIPGHTLEKEYSVLAAFDPINTLTINTSQNPFIQLQDFWKEHNDWIFGHLSYDLKNRIEKLQSNHPDNIGFPEMCFFQPRYIIEILKEKAIIWYAKNESQETARAIFRKIEETIIHLQNEEAIEIQPVFSKKDYIDTIIKIKQHIQKGDIYEVNLCQEFFGTDKQLNPSFLFNKLCNLSPAPFSCFYKIDNKYLISASPERFLKKISDNIISQPIKGTSIKGNNQEETNILKRQLAANPKERAENIMIVDLVRNDLSRTAIANSVKVDELCGIYEFPQVLQMISTVSSKIPDQTRFVETIRSAFPMGSMTGAPKLRAMEIIEAYEKTLRGLYSGTVGYINPDGDFDFNVVIRSIQYNAETGYISFLTGGAITIKSEPEKEYEECLIKAKGLLMALHGKLKVND